LLNVCSYPSQEPNSDPSDCVVTPETGFLTIKKTVENVVTSSLFPKTFTFNASAASRTGVSSWQYTANSNVVAATVVLQVPYAVGTTLDLNEVDPGNGWSFSSASCELQTATPTATGTPTTTGVDNITIQNGFETICTFINTENLEETHARLTLQKTVVNDNGGTLTANDFPRFIDGSSVAWNTSVLLTVGQHTASETTQAGYAASDWGGDCAANGTITLAAGENKTCTITNDDVAPRLTVIKHVVNDNGGGAVAGAWTMNVTATNPSSASFAGAESPGTTITLSAGAFSVAESGGPASGYTQTGAVGCSGTAVVGGTYTCTITNDDIPARLTVNKVCSPTTDTGKFNLLIDTVARATDASCGGTTGVVYVNAGLHTVAETAGTSTNLSDYVTTINGACGANGQVTLALGQTATCTITNTKKGMVTLRKLTNGVESQSMIWNFRLSGGSLASAVTDSTPPPLVDFGGVKLTPILTHTICETGIPAGWTLEWKVDTNNDGTPDTIIPFFAGGNTPPAWTGYSNVYDPNYVAPPAVYTNDTRCVQFTVNPGQTLAFEINNSFPGGEPRTIGYWKNWNTCTGGRQDTTAANNGGPAAGWYILDNLLNNPGYTLGPVFPNGLRLDGDPNNVLTGVTSNAVTGSDCVAAVRILDKSRITDGRKLASDGAYNMAAQLLAALLNLSAGAETCSGVQTAVNQAQALLVQIGFNGTAQSYLKSGSVFAQANALASTLDQYNNGNLCTP
jgi:hypothetical protein